MTTNQIETKNMNFKSCFDIIGPIMIGPSSSHTAGAIGIGFLAHKLFQGKPTNATVKYYESFAETHKGHGTDYAIASGILGFSTDDVRVPAALDILKEENIVIEFIEIPHASPVGHPNTACITLSNEHERIHVTGISIGGGLIEVKEIQIAGFDIKPQGSLPIILVIYPKDATLVEGDIDQILESSLVKINAKHVFKAKHSVLLEYDLDTELPKQVRKQLGDYCQDYQFILL
ncbi:L-serine ammonia-lyase, iron-sulfur-dependent subunit beta [Vagococcus jeotgali]|uniref:L-serine ammonia-lyase, iron-sulfur-dependent subunit beta n=1 Tax=Vagococcus jeotgali TaxID=3109030 RepID=UPI002DDBF255|nr:L-serine ammonia-lyase, iron-sulfur-dependent subunit beta [Vagococcus sp. B2T-5]